MVPGNNLVGIDFQSMTIMGEQERCHKDPYDAFRSVNLQPLLPEKRAVSCGSMKNVARAISGQMLPIA